MIDLSVVIITLNEEARLGRCLASLPEGVEVVVLDSGSLDRTLEIAGGYNALTATRRFDDYASQKNAAIAMASRTWILSIDADEVLSETLARGISNFIGSPEAKDSRDSYRLTRRLFFMGRAMRFGKTCDAPVRLFRRGTGKFHSKIHEQYRSEPGSTGKILRRNFGSGAWILHFSYEDLTDYFKKFNNYTSRIAEQRSESELNRVAFAAHVTRPLFEFGSRYFMRLGFLDGYPGYCYALLSSLYAFVKYAKRMEQNLK